MFRKSIGDVPTAHFYSKMYTDLPFFDILYEFSMSNLTQY